ncbi:hypothetical protein FRB90_012639 [Tulasnella sp. 427]|nr:hypothetical protein FRB90_012639 [Tulasnella sp. 427]
MESTGHIQKSTTNLSAGLKAGREFVCKRSLEVRDVEEAFGRVSIECGEFESGRDVSSVEVSITESEQGWTQYLNPFRRTQCKESKALSARVHKLKATIYRKDREIRRLSNKEKDMTETLAEKERELRGRMYERDELRRRLNEVEKGLGAKLAEKERELEEMKKTLCMYDDCSEVDIASMMSGINTRIHSLARNTAQRWLRGSNKLPEETRDTRPFLTEVEMETCRGIIGAGLVRALGSPSPGQSRCVLVLLPLGWQAAMVKVVAKILSSFVAGIAASEEGRTFDKALQKVSDQVRKGEIQPAFGRWRFVTHQYTKQLFNQESSLQHYVQEALGLCRLVARLALKSNCPDDKAFLGAFHSHLTEVVEETFKLQAHIQEKMLTANYEPCLAVGGTAFGAEAMELDKGERTVPGDVVICTVRLGLISTRKRERENSGVILQDILLKPRVLTEYNLQDIMAASG